MSNRNIRTNPTHSTKNSTDPFGKYTSLIRQQRKRQFHPLRSRKLSHGVLKAQTKYMISPSLGQLRVKLFESRHFRRTTSSTGNISVSRRQRQAWLLNHRVDKDDREALKTRQINL